ncbi:MAG: RNA 3'-terminal phosphate cyclase, partial [Candidatus Nanohaloarchaea archaeon]|nr:RNA 3'-terminal phosphate cyclase [Candidatus Nanohaloarchaea archaeon]
LGEKGKRSEQVGKEAAESLVERMGGPGVIDPWMADQVMPYLGVCGGEVLLPRVTDHVSSCIEVVEAFLGVEIGLEERDGGVLARRV